MNSKEILLSKVYGLIAAYKSGSLGGDKMPEDENPHLAKHCKENYMYFTLPMALNYQRNSYTLWKCANRMHTDPESRRAFDSKEVCAMSNELLRSYLVEYGVALQPNKQPVIWRTLCETIEKQFEGDIRNLFIHNEYSVERIKAYIQHNKKNFPYLGGNKICNYWLYVLEQYTDLVFVDRENITVAPDTHVIQASQRLGLITEQEAQLSNVQMLVADRWKELLTGKDLKPIDVHTPLWLWSRNKFKITI